jgi:hypothetical protein
MSDKSGHLFGLDSDSPGYGAKDDWGNRFALFSNPLGLKAWDDDCDDNGWLGRIAGDA